MADGHIDVLRFESNADMLHSWCLIPAISLMCLKKFCVTN